MSLRSHLFFLLLLPFASCTLALPEFQTAQSLAQGEQRLVAGGFTGYGLNTSTGVAAAHSYGLSDRWDWNTHLGIARLQVEDPNIKYSALTGPKWSTQNGNFAITAPTGIVYLNYLDALDEGVAYTTTPTVMYSWHPSSRHSLTFWVRNEWSYNFFYGRWYWAVAGTTYKFPIESRSAYWSISGTRGGIYTGIGISLFE